MVPFNKIAVFLVAVFFTILPATQNWSFYTRKYDHEKVTNMYDQSQYISFLIWMCWLYCIYMGVNIVIVGIARYIVPVYPVLVILVPRAFSEIIAYGRIRIAK